MQLLRYFFKPANFKWSRKNVKCLCYNMVVTRLFFYLKQTSHCTLGDNKSSLNATEMVQLVSMEPLQLIDEEQRNIRCVGFVLPAVQLHLRTHAN